MTNVNFDKFLTQVGEIGFINKVVSSLVYAEGLPGAKPEELVIFESGELGEVTALTESNVEILGFSKNPVRVGSRVVRTNKALEVPVGEELLGRVLNPLGRSIDPSSPVPPMKEMRPIEILPPGIGKRARIKTPCHTGVALADLMIPLGKGQRELVMGDQKTGKSRFLLRSLLTQVRQGAVGVYAVIGKGQVAVKQIEESLRQLGIMDRTVIVTSMSDDASGMIFLTPYTAMTIAEYFRDAGRDVLLVLDDLSVHAKAYREIALLGRRFPGRNSYPGDIFYTHARLLERAGNFITPLGERAITCLPVVETTQGDLTGFIQTNIMAMTDGHIFFDHTLFAEGRRPAIDPFLSVTRVGRQTQTPLQREVGRTLITFLREVAGLHNFASFGAELGERIRSSLEKEKRIMQFFDQTAYDSIPANLQLVLFGLIWGDFWQEKNLEEVRLAIQKTIFMYETRLEVRRRVDGTISLCDSTESLINHIGDLDFFK